MHTGLQKIMSKKIEPFRALCLISFVAVVSSQTTLANDGSLSEDCNKRFSEQNELLQKETNTVVSLNAILICLAKDLPYLQTSIEHWYNCDFYESPHGLNHETTRSCQRLFNMSPSDDSLEALNQTVACEKVQSSIYDTVVTLGEEAEISLQKANVLVSNIQESIIQKCPEVQRLLQNLENLVQNCKALSSLSTRCSLHLINSNTKSNAGNCPWPHERRDCNGDCGGSARIEPCARVCYGGNTSLTADHYSHLYDCAHQCNGTFTIDDCSVCVADGAIPSIYRDCTGKCYPPAKKSAMATLNDCGNCVGGDTGLPEVFGKDQCGICGGDNSVCTDCSGVPNGESVEDACGTCGGDNSSCLALTSVSLTAFPALNTRTIHIRGAGFNRPNVECALVNTDGEWITGETQNPDNSPDSIDCVVTVPACTYTIIIKHQLEMVNSSMSVIVFNATEIETFEENFTRDNFTVREDNRTTVDFWGVGYDKLNEIYCHFEGRDCFWNEDRIIRVTANISSDTHLSCSLRTPITSCNMTVFLSANDGKDALSPVYHNIIYAWAPNPTIHFSHVGYKLEVTFDRPVDHTSLTCCTYIFENLHKTSKCWWPTDSTLEVRIGVIDNFIVPGDRLRFKEGAVRSAGQKYSLALSGEYQVGPPLTVPLIKSVITGPSEIHTCGRLVLSGERSLGGAGRGLQYRWSVQPNINMPFDDGSSTIDLDRASINDNLVYRFSLEVENFLGNKDKSMFKVKKLNRDVPTVNINTNPDTEKIKISSRLELVTAVGQSDCSNDRRVYFHWSVSHPLIVIGPEMIKSRQIVMEPYTLPPEDEITFTVTTWYEGEEDDRSSSNITVHTVTQQLVPIISGGKERVVSRSDHELLFDGSLSYDPDGTSGFLTYTWSCIRDCGTYCYSFKEDSLDELFPFGSQSDVRRLKFDGEHLAAGKVYFLKLTVSKGNRVASAVQTLRVIEHRFPTVMLDLSKGDRTDKLNKIISAKATISSHLDVQVEWQLLDQAERIVDLLDARETTVYSGQQNTHLALLQFAEAILRPGVRYTLIVQVKDSHNQSAEAHSEDIYLSLPATGCQLKVSKYTVYQLVSLTVESCQIPPSCHPATFTYSIQTNSGVLRHLSEPVREKHFTVIGPPSVSVNRTNRFAVEVCTISKICQMFFSSETFIGDSDDRTRETNRQQGINLISHLDHTGDTLTALVNTVNLIQTDAKFGSSEAETSSLERLFIHSLLNQHTLESVRVILDQLFFLEAQQLGSSRLFLQVLSKALNRYKFLSSVITPGVFTRVTNFIGKLRHKVPEEELMKVLNVVIYGFKKVSLNYGDKSDYVETPDVAQMTTTYRPLETSFHTSNGSSAVEIEFGTELRSRYLDWDCGTSLKCNGVVIRLIHYNKSVDPITTTESRKVGESRISDIVDAQIENPETGEEIVIKNLTSPVNLTFRFLPRSINSTRSCRYWCGVSWSKKGMRIEEIDESTVICSSNHLTAFSVFEEYNTSNDDVLILSSAPHRVYEEMCPIPGEDRDCHGDCGGSAKMEPCAQICYGGKTSLTADHFSHLYDCAHQCNGTFTIDDCSVCVADVAKPSIYRDCTGKCYPPALKELMAVENDCGICVGGNTGLPLDADKEECGLCRGDNSDCFDCKGIPNGNSVEDVCGICDGNNASCFQITSARPKIFIAYREMVVAIKGAGFNHPDVECLVENVDGEWINGETRNPDNMTDRLDCILTLPPCEYSLHVRRKAEMAKGSINMIVYNDTEIHVESFSPSTITISELADIKVHFYGNHFLKPKPIQCIFSAGDCVPGPISDILVVVEASVLTDSHISCTLSMVTSSCDLKVFLSENYGADAISPTYHSVVYAAAPHPSIRFQDIGYKLEVTFDRPVDHTSLTCCTYIFENLHKTSKCWWPTNSTLEVRIGRIDNFIMPGDYLKFKEGAVRAADQRYTYSLSGGYPINPPVKPHPVKSVITGPSEISRCAQLVLYGGSSQGAAGRGLKYRWSVEPNLGSRLTDESGSLLEVPGSLLTEGISYKFTLYVVNFLGSKDLSSHNVVGHNKDIPTVLLVSNVNTERVVTSSRVVLKAEVTSSVCSGSHPVLYEWSTSHPLLIQETKQTKQPQLIIEPYTFSGGEAVRITLTSRYSDHRSRFVSSNKTLYVVSRPLVATIQGGRERVVSRNDPALIFDGSLSNDPDQEAGHMAYSWSCIRDCGTYCYSFKEDSLYKLFPFGSQSDDRRLKFDGEHLGAGKVYFLKLTVSKGIRVASTIQTFKVIQDSFPTVYLEQSSDETVKSVISTKAVIQSDQQVQVHWRLIENNERHLDIADSTTSTFQLNEANSYISLFQFPTAKLRPGVSYVVAAKVIDALNRTTEALAEEVQLSAAVTGCLLEASNYTQLHRIRIRTTGCQYTEDMTPLIYAYSLEGPTGASRRLTGDTVHSNLLMIGPPSLPGSPFVQFKVKVCTSHTVCQDFSSPEIFVEQPTVFDANVREEVIQQVAMSELTGDYVNALVNMVSLLQADKTPRSKRSIPDMDGTLDLITKSLDTAELVTDIEVIAHQLSLVHQVNIVSPDEFLAFYSQIITRYVQNDFHLTNEIFEKIATGLAALKGSVSKTLFDSAVLALIDSIRGRSMVPGQTLTFGNRNTVVEVTLAYRSLNEELSSAKERTTVQVNFGSQLNLRYRDWDCGTSVRCNGAVVRLVHFSQTVDPITASKSQQERETRISNIIDIELQHPNTGDGLLVKNLTSPLTLTFTLPARQPTSVRSCRYWCGVSWSKKGMSTREVDESVVVCSANHLASFSVFEEYNSTTAESRTWSDVHAEAIVGGVLGALIIVICVCLAIKRVERKSKVTPSLQSLREPEESKA